MADIISLLFARDLRTTGLAVGLALVTSVIASGAVALASGGSHRRGAPRPMRHLRAKTIKTPLVFGVYPGGAAGTVGPSGETKPEDPAKRIAALQRLRPHGHPFVLHLYALYTGGDGWSAAQQVGQEIASYGREGFQTELALCYRPADGGSPAAVAGFVGFVRDTLRRLGRTRGFTSLQVTNEANAGGSPNASDGYYRQAADALVEGVIAAKQAIRAEGLKRIEVGFNWAYGIDDAERTFWSYLGQRGGRRFVRALDWVGFDAFPGTWGPALGGGQLHNEAADFMDGALRRLRSEYMPLARIPRSVPLRVTESGYPTGPGRSEANQVAVMTAAVHAVYRARLTYNVEGFRWFDLRDADSAGPTFESQYGLLRDDYSPKPAFAAYRKLVAELAGR